MGIEYGKNYLGTQIIINTKGSDANKSLSDQEVAETIQMSDLVVSASLGEGFGLLMAEAMAAGKCVVHPQYSTPIELLDDESLGVGKRGIVVPSKVDVISSYNVQHGFVDAKDLACAIEEAYSDKDKCDEMGRNGRIFAERYLDWDDLVFNQWIPTIKKNV